MCVLFQLYVSQLSEKVRAERCRSPPPVMIEGKTTDQALRKIRCIINKNVSLLILIGQRYFSFQLHRSTRYM